MAAEDAALDAAALDEAAVLDAAVLDAAVLDVAADEAADEALEADALLALDDAPEEHPTAITSTAAHADIATIDFSTCFDFMANPFPCSDDVMVPCAPPKPPSSYTRVAKRARFVKKCSLCMSYGLLFK